MTGARNELSNKGGVMKTWQIVLLIIAVVYALGVAGMFIYLRGGNFKMALLWPLTVLWMLFGNIG